MSYCRSFIVFADEVDSNGRKRTWRMSPEFLHKVEAEDYLEYIRTGWPRAYLLSFECDPRMAPQAVADQVRPWLYN